jgi:hypothetical protein
MQAKCSLSCRKENYCGFAIDKNCINAQKHKTRAVIDWPQPENCKDIRGFQSLTSYLGKFNNHYAPIAMPLYANGTTPNKKEDVVR